MKIELTVDFAAYDELL